MQVRPTRRLQMARPDHAVLQTAPPPPVGASAALEAAGCDAVGRAGQGEAGKGLRHTSRGCALVCAGLRPQHTCGELFERQAFVCEDCALL